MEPHLFHQPETFTRGDYGIVANVTEADRLMRANAKCWISGGTGGEGWHRFQWIGLSRSARTIEKWIPTMRMGNFRAAWVPNHLRGALWYVRGTRDEMETMARDLEEFAARERALHPNRRAARSDPQKAGPQ